MEYKPNSNEMLCRLYAIMAVMDDEYTRPEHEILKDIMREKGFDYERVNLLYRHLRMSYVDDYEKAINDTLEAITDEKLRYEAIKNLKKIAISDGILHKNESLFFEKIKELWNIDIKNLK